MNPKSIILMVIAGLVIADTIITYITYKRTEGELEHQKECLKNACCDTRNMLSNVRGNTNGLTKLFERIEEAESNTRKQCKQIECLKERIVSKWGPAITVTDNPNTIVLSDERNNKKKKNSKNK